MLPKALDDFGLASPKHNGSIARLVPDYIPDRIPKGKELAMLNIKCDEFLRERGYIKMTREEWLYPNRNKNKKGVDKK